MKTNWPWLCDSVAIASMWLLNFWKVDFHQKTKQDLEKSFFDFILKFYSDNRFNKKVLLRERKRHTARRVASTPYVVLTGYPPPPRVPPWQGTPPAGYPPWQGTPPGRVPPWQGTPWLGTPRQGTPLPGYPPRQGTPLPGYPPSWTWQGNLPWLPHGILGNVAKHYGIRVPPLWTDRQTCVKTLPSRRTTYAGGNNDHNNDRWGILN